MIPGIGNETLLINYTFICGNEFLTSIKTKKNLFFVAWGGWDGVGEGGCTRDEMGVMTLNIMTFNIMTFSIMTFSIMTFSIMTLA